ncbi:hypothetical protein ABIE45_006418 [Methylobacterium sp. OAE515]
MRFAKSQFYKAHGSLATIARPAAQTGSPLTNLDAFALDLYVDCYFQATASRAKQLHD